MSFMRKWLRHLIFGHSATLFLLKGLKAAIKRELNTAPKPIINEIKKNASALIKKNQQLVTDGASKGHLEFSSHVLASYQILLPKFDNQKRQTVAFIKEATFDSYNSLMLRLSFRLIFSLCKNDVAKLRSLFSWLMKQYGTTFNWETTQEKQPNTRFVMTIQRCFYFEFFKAHDAAFLTPVLCQLDGIWFELIEPQRDGFKFDKKHYQTQGYGADECVFPIDQLKKN